MKILSEFFSKATGSIGEMTFAMRGRSIVAKRKPNPTNPNTQLQKNVRGFLALAVTSWQGMDPEARSKWEAHAVTLKSKDALGVEKKVSGWSSFAGGYVLMKQGSQVVDNLLLGNNLANGYLSSKGLTVEADSAGGLTMTNHSGKGGIFSIYVSTVQNATVNKNGKGYKFLKAQFLDINGSTTVGVDVAIGKKLFFKIQNNDVNGNISKPTVINLYGSGLLKVKETKK
ncbi:MAG: hypothetical protein FE834_06535 [Gammaproteobacteria bacterium]|nr:hypothetical protein [Gammaproteobacteria bacterium]